MADNVPITAGSGTDIATDDAGAGGHVQRVKLAIATDGSAVAIPSDATDGLLVNLGGNNDVTAVGNIAHDTGDSGAPVKVGMKAIDHGANPTAVTANDRTDWYANRAGVPFVMGGHPNIVTVRHTVITTAVTNAAIITVATGTKIVVTGFQVTLDCASTVFPSVLIGFATATTPTTTGVIGSHGGLSAGGGFGRGDGSGIIGIGADDEDLRVTTVGNATGGGVHIVVSYYTIPA